MAEHDRIDYQSDRIFEYSKVTIASGQKESEAIDSRGGVMVRYAVPATMTGTSFTFKIADKPDDTFLDYYNTAGNQVTASMNAGKATGIINYDFKGCQLIKFVSDSNEAADREIEVWFRGE